MTTSSRPVSRDQRQEGRRASTARAPATRSLTRATRSADLGNAGDDIRARSTRPRTRWTASRAIPPDRGTAHATTIAGAPGHLRRAGVCAPAAGDDPAGAWSPPRPGPSRAVAGGSGRAPSAGHHGPERDYSRASVAASRSAVGSSSTRIGHRGRRTGTPGAGARHHSGARCLRRSASRRRRAANPRTNRAAPPRSRAPPVGQVGVGQREAVADRRAEQVHALRSHRQYRARRPRRAAGPRGAGADLARCTPELQQELHQRRLAAPLGPTIASRPPAGSRTRSSMTPGDGLVGEARPRTSRPAAAAGGGPRGPSRRPATRRSARTAADRRPRSRRAVGRRPRGGRRPRRPRWPPAAGPRAAPARWFRHARPRSRSRARRPRTGR